MPGNSKELFKFLWTLENMGVWGYRQSIRSPRFVVEKLSNAVFYLELFEKEQDSLFCSLYLNRAKDDGAPEQVKFKFALEIPARDVWCKTADRILVNTKRLDDGWGWHNFIENARFFQVDDWFLYSGDVTIECTLYEADEKLGVDRNKPEVGKASPKIAVSRRVEQLSARTRLRTEEMSLKWNVERFSQLPPEEKVTTEVFSFADDCPSFLVSLSVSPVAEKVEMGIENLRNSRSNPVFVACKVSFLVTGGVRVVMTSKHAFGSDQTNAVWRFPVLAERRELIPGKSEFLPNDVLSLLLEFKVCDGIQFAKVGKTVYGSVSGPANPGVREPTPLRENSLKMFREQQTCDVSFETATKTIRAHKFILFANSSVFRAMFDHETVEKKTNTIRVTDIGFETLEHFLAYLYIQKLEGETDAQLAMQLYFAADKYRVDSLKDECSQFLKRNLRTENVCDVLELADRHQDQGLKDSARDFVARCKAQVLDSDEWKRLSSKSPQLVIEVLQSFCWS